MLSLGKIEVTKPNKFRMAESDNIMPTKITMAGARYIAE
tara:strand:- start:153 stop:269 length:117 start_codon:yes stop_codon:yes gene_type:complete